MRFSASVLVLLLVPLVASAADVSFVSNPVWLSTAKTTEGETVQASTVITKQGAEAISGTVTFFDNGKVLGTSDFLLPSGVGGVVVALSFVPEKGTHVVSAKITQAVSGDQALSVTGEAKAGGSLIVEPDNDRDKITDAIDMDDDNDGVSDVDEKKAGTDPLKKEIVAQPQVAGASTTASGALNQATAIAKSVGGTVFEKTEGFRLNGADYFDKKIAEEEAKRSATKPETTPEQDLDEKLIHPKSLTEQISDTSGIVEGIKIQAYKVFSFIFNNVYIFYIIIIFFVLWILRKIWRRHSLN
jgi:hypothetical protein